VDKERQGQSPNDPIEPLQVGLYSVATNLLLVGLKLGLAALSSSLALMADALHSLVDVIGSLVVVVGLLIARRRSESFPYGLYKVENLASVLVAILIFLAGYELAREALYAPPRDPSNIHITLIGVALTVIIAYSFSRYERRLAKSTGSPSLMADSEHFRADMLSSGVVFAAILGNIFSIHLDRIGAIVIVLFILRAGWGLLVDGMRVLLDASLSHDTLNHVREVIASDRQVVSVKSLVGRNSGRYKFLEADVILRTHDLDKAHQVSQHIEDTIKNEVPLVDRVLIHYEPAQRDITKWAIPLESTGEIVSKHFGEAHHFLIIHLHRDSGEIVARELVANPHLKAEKQKGILVAKLLIDKGIDGLLVRESINNRGPSYVLADAGVNVVVIDKETLPELFAELRSHQPN